MEASYESGPVVSEQMFKECGRRRTTGASACTLNSSMSLRLRQAKKRRDLDVITANHRT